MTESVETRHFLIVHHGSDRLGLNLNSVREVLRMLALRNLPGTPDVVWGAMDLRSEIIPVLYLEARLPAGSSAPGIDHQIVVMDAGDNESLSSVGVIVDRAEGLLEVQEADYRDIRDLLPEWVPLDGLVRTQDGPLPILDPLALLKDGEAITIQEALAQLEQKGKKVGKRQKRSKKES